MADKLRPHTKPDCVPSWDDGGDLDDKKDLEEDCEQDARPSQPYISSSYAETPPPAYGYQRAPTTAPPHDVVVDIPAAGEDPEATPPQPQGRSTCCKWATGLG